MYKIYINETPLILINHSELDVFLPVAEKVMVANYLGKPKFIFNFVDLLEKTNKYHAILLCSNDKEKLFRDVVMLFPTIQAGGGLVLNPREEILFIFRRGMWDLPKGKMDKRESIEQTSVREVREETGITKLLLGDLLCQTYHLYKLKGKRVIKHTTWYLMYTDQTKVKPQIEEQIEKIEWMSLETFEKGNYFAFKNIHDVLVAWREKMK